MIVTVASQKGGVGKTTTAVAVGHGLARRGWQVRLVDFDPQGHLALTLGLDPEPGVFEYLVGERPMVEVVRETGRCGLSLLAGNSRTRTTETVLRAEATLVSVAAQIRALGEGVDVVVIDTPPSGRLQEVAVSVADRLIVPVYLEALGMDGLARTLEMAALLQGRKKETLRMCILPTAFDQRLNEHHDNWNLVKAHYPEQTLHCIPARVAVAEATAAGRTIWEYGGRGIGDVQAAYGYLLDWMEQQGMTEVMHDIAG